MRTVLIVLLMLLTTLISAQTLWDNALPIRQGANIEWSRTSASTDDGGIIYVWSATQSGGRDLFAMKYDALGNPQWGENAITIDSKIDRQEAPVIVKTSDAGFIIAWVDYSLDQYGDIFGQKINSDGNLLWQEGGIPICTYQGNQNSLNIVKNNLGGAYILWNDMRNTSTDLYAVNLDGDGTNLWATDGMPIANTNNPETSNSMREDGDGGFLLGYQVYSDNYDNIFTKRYNSAGESVWGEALAIFPSTGNQSELNLINDGTGGFIFVWNEREDSINYLLAQRLLSDGSTDWDSAVEIYNNENYGTLYPQIDVDGMGNIILAWEFSDFNTISGIYAQKISTSGELLWDEGGVEVIDNQVQYLTLRIDSDVNGGAYLIWADTRNGYYPDLDIYAQHLNEDGIPQWEEDGMAISTSGKLQNQPLIKRSGDMIFAVWLDAETGSNGIKQQIIDDSGNTLLADNGETVTYGLSGKAGQNGLIEIHPRLNQNDAVVVWLDSRFAFDGHKIYFQFLNPDGTVDLETNGRPITVNNSNYHQSDFQVAINDAGETIVVWVEQRDNYNKIYAQLIDVEGNYLWGDEGMEMSSLFTVEQADPKVSYFNGDFYLGWSDNLIADDWTFYHQVFGQRISNGEKQWGENGIQISGSLTGELDSDIELCDVIGNYYIWDTFVYDRRVAKVNEAGQILDGYSIEGNDISPLNTHSNLGSGAIYDNTLFYSWVDNQDDYISTVFTQGFADDGTFAWQEGIPTSSHNYDAYSPNLVIGDAIYVTWNESQTSYNQNIKAQKISFTGDHQFANGGIMIGEDDVNQRYPKIAKINNENYVIAWEQHEGLKLDLYMNLLRSNGETLNGSTGIPLITESKEQKSVRIAPMGDNKAFFVWEDFRASGKEEIIDIYSQYVDFSPVSNEDNNNAQIVTSSLAQNYPNPFNPTTKISFNLVKDTKDVELSIYNLKGQKVKTLVRDNFSKGSYSFVWNGDNDQDNTVSSGVYFYKLKAGNQTSTKKMVLMK